MTLSSSGDDDADNKFQIDEVTGLIETSANALDRETRANYVLIVSVTDSGSPQRMVLALDSGVDVFIIGGISCRVQP